MNKKDMYTNGPTTSCESDVQGVQSNFPEMLNSRKRYDRLDKLDNEAKPSTAYLPRNCFSPHVLQDFTVSSCNHFQDLNEKFQELECKMFEVEQCFKEANRRDVKEVQRLKGYGDIRSPLESVPNPDKVSGAYRYRVAESRKTTDEYTSDGIITKGWIRNHKATGTEDTKFENQIGKDGSGDALRTSKASSQDSCKTMIESLDRPRPHLLNRQGVKGIFTMNQIDNEPKHESSNMFEENNKSIEVDLLEKSKQLILSLIDKELKKIENKPNHLLQANQVEKASDNPCDNTKNLKIECIQNIEKELKTLTKLESLDH